jgi:hypothetical protein
MAFKVTSWVPEDKDLLAALGRIAVLHGHLEYCLRATFKTVTGRDIGTSLRETQLKRFRELRCQIKEETQRRIGDRDAVDKLVKLLDRSRSATDERNKLLHGFWCERDGAPMDTHRGREEAAEHRASSSSNDSGTERLGQRTRSSGG